jgi:hypothetical protein
MNWFSWLVWGFGSTAVLTTLMAGSEGIGVTRMNIPHMLGTMFTPNRDRAKVYGAVLHFLNGWAFSIVYVAAFHAAGLFTWWFGLLLSLVHTGFVLAVVLPVMPGVHPRMASALRGPTVSRQLEPPGFLALNYGVRTPISVLVAHLAFGALLGGLYRPTPRREVCARAMIRQETPSASVAEVSGQDPIASSAALPSGREASSRKTMLQGGMASGLSGKRARSQSGPASSGTSKRSVACSPAASHGSERSPPTSNTRPITGPPVSIDTRLI